MKILGIETSADDSGIALIEATGTFGSDFKFKILGNAISSQTIHSEYGGIFPNLAKREHAQNLPPLLDKVLARHFMTKKNELDIDCIAVTVGPGLEPCLWTGINFAQELAKKWNVPVVPVNHMEGHIIMSLVRHDDSEQRAVNREQKMHASEFPAIALLISGGHTELILMKGVPGRAGSRRAGLGRADGEYEYIGRTRDDAVGEAFDKVARTLGLPYPGGPHVSALAERARKDADKTQTAAENTNVLLRDSALSPRESALRLPRPMLHDDSYDFSFAGLKTAVSRLVEEHQPLTNELKQHIAREFEDAVTDVLVQKTLRAVDEYGSNAVIMGGGVSANKHIREELVCQLSTVNCKLLVCPPEFSTDNGLMIALAGYFRAQNKEFANIESVRANGNLKLC